VNLNNDTSVEIYKGDGSSLKGRQRDPVKAQTKTIQKIDHYPITPFQIVVEGGDDKIIYKSVFNGALCKIIPLWGKDNVKYVFKKDIPGKSKVVKKVKNFLKDPANQQKVNMLVDLKQENMIIGITDLDCEKEKNCKNYYKPSDYHNLFVTETNDAQTLLLKNYGLTIFIKKLCETVKVKRFKELHKLPQLHKCVIIMTNYPGLARCLDKRLSKEIAGYQNLSFKVLYPENVFNEFISDNRLLTSKDILDLLFSKEAGNYFNIDFHKAYREKIAILTSDFPDRWDLCQGHDMMRVLLSIHRLVGCAKSYECENDLIEDISKFFHLPKYAFFNKTSLYQALKKWETDCFPYPEIGMFSEIYSIKEGN